MKKRLKTKEKLYVVRQYIKAKNVLDAIKKSRKADVHECWVDEKWSEGNREQLADAIGFEVAKKDDDDE